MSTGINELIFDGFVANVGIGIVPLFCSASLAKEVSVPVVCGTDPVSLSWCRTVVNSLMILGRIKC